MEEEREAPGFFDDVVDAIGAYFSDAGKSEKLRSAFVDPVINQLTNRFSLLFKSIQALAVLLVIQFLFVVWILIRSYRR
jgi:hypothetical protein